MDRRPPLWSAFRRPKPEGKWSLAHPLREPVRFVGQSMVAWPAAAFAAIMMAAPKEAAEPLPGIVKLVLQATVVYPLIVGVAFALYFLLVRMGQPAHAALPLMVPMALCTLWGIVFVLFLFKYLMSLLGVPL